MNVQMWAGVFGLVVCAIFAFTSIRELRRNVPGHALNAAKIHIGMVALFVPFCIWILIAYAP
ncbi:MAG: hypothetical protein ABS49_07070 [Erythrobacter sp. SCN 62-14]|nr:MAG: hypothetical protein ABS49_07070 [Erythrobacter sp. SCN 62-14]